jgi:hypothetical protein
LYLTRVSPSRLLEAPLKVQSACGSKISAIRAPLNRKIDDFSSIF